VQEGIEMPAHYPGGWVGVQVDSFLAKEKIAGKIGST